MSVLQTYISCQEAVTKVLSTCSVLNLDNHKHQDPSVTTSESKKEAKDQESIQSIQDTN